MIVRCHSRMALYKEWISTQPLHGDCPVSFQAIDQENPKGQLYIIPYICLCLVSESTLFFYNAHVSLPQS